MILENGGNGTAMYSTLLLQFLVLRVYRQYAEILGSSYKTPNHHDETKRQNQDRKSVAAAIITVAARISLFH